MGKKSQKRSKKGSDAAGVTETNSSKTHQNQTDRFTAASTSTTTVFESALPTTVHRLNPFYIESSAPTAASHDSSVIPSSETAISSQLYHHNLDYEDDDDDREEQFGLLEYEDYYYDDGCNQDNIQRNYPSKENHPQQLGKATRKRNHILRVCLCIIFSMMILITGFILFILNSSSGYTVDKTKSITITQQPLNVSVKAPSKSPTTASMGQPTLHPVSSKPTNTKVSPKSNNKSNNERHHPSVAPSYLNTLPANGTQQQIVPTTTPRIVPTRKGKR